ncbi:hypothetical protein HYALB_00003941 [Hymenoscyphus albidus]|uniref:SRR1-like domain-containing protein n=1 Tax=Hymenoscyphus albidus TaxID=595503 RepID=A0A9N9Q4S0_9HELO|nr:hypothetical protein HYALB_00003941 [Hymenoscyphus albidus]
MLRMVPRRNLLRDQHNVLTSKTYVDFHLLRRGTVAPEDFSRILREAKEKFEQTREYERPTEELLMLKLRLKEKKIEKVVLIGAGSLNTVWPKDGKSWGRHQEYDNVPEETAPFHYLRALRCCEILGEPYKPLPIYAQSLLSSSAEKKYFSSLPDINITVLDDPDVFEKIDENTLVCSAVMDETVDFFIAKAEKKPAALLTERFNWQQNKNRYLVYTPEVRDVVDALYASYVQMPVAEHVGRDRQVLGAAISLWISNQL